MELSNKYKLFEKQIIETKLDNSFPQFHIEEFARLDRLDRNANGFYYMFEKTSLLSFSRIQVLEIII